MNLNVIALIEQGNQTIKKSLLQSGTVTGNQFVTEDSFYKSIKVAGGEVVDIFDGVSDLSKVSLVYVSLQEVTPYTVKNNNLRFTINSDHGQGHGHDLFEGSLFVAANTQTFHQLFARIPAQLPTGDWLLSVFVTTKP